MLFERNRLHKVVCSIRSIIYKNIQLLVINLKYFDLKFECNIIQDIVVITHIFTIHSRTKMCVFTLR